MSALNDASAAGSRKRSRAVANAPPSKATAPSAASDAPLLDPTADAFKEAKAKIRRTQPAYQPAAPPEHVRQADNYPSKGKGKKKDYTDYALLSKAAYEHGANLENVPKAFERDDELSNFDRTVFHNSATGEAVIAYRGTIPTHVSDLETDAAIAIGAESKTKRFKEADKVAKAAIAKYGKEHVTLTGHSLGGTQALYVAARNDLKAAAFNPGKGFDGLRSLQYLTGKKAGSSDKARIYATGYDPISVNSLLGSEKVTLVKPKSKNPLKVHDIGNFY